MKSDGISFTNTKQAIITNTSSVAEQDLFPIVTKILDKYLTEPINNTIKTEISQYLFVTANMIELNNEELNCEQRWYKNLYQDETNLQEKVIFNNKKDIYDDETMNNNTLPVRKPVTIPITVPVLKKAVHKRNLYGRVWGLARTVTLLAVEQEDDEITLILLDYIRRKSNRNMPERLPIIINERSTIDEVSDNPQEIQRNYNDTNSRIENRSQIEEDETEKDREIIDTNLQNMKI
ncbi:unnamed protein product [Rhizophagus irregularis]|uniref:EH domain-containing protein n=1 Tax=Rhizophagus irregularis TaxID=588596 RepID=A0A915Z4J9_9GLOM|nr:unnamed protein product [Rhizophagus irregularis]